MLLIIGFSRFGHLVTFSPGSCTAHTCNHPQPSHSISLICSKSTHSQLLLLLFCFLFWPVHNSISIFFLLLIIVLVLLLWQSIVRSSIIGYTNLTYFTSCIYVFLLYLQVNYLIMIYNFVLKDLQIYALPLRISWFGLI